MSSEENQEQRKKVPPKVAPKPGSVKVLRALYAYEAQQEDELSFKEGDILYLIDQTDQNWWKARIGLKQGIVPSNHVELNTEILDNPIHDASRRGNLSFLQECFANGVSAITLDATGNSALHWSSKAGHVDCVREILKASTNQYKDIDRFVNVQNKLGETALHCAALKDREEIVSLLLEHRANPLINNCQNQKAIDFTHSPSIKTLLMNATDQYVADQDYSEYLDDSDPEEM